MYFKVLVMLSVVITFASVGSFAATVSYFGGSVSSLYPHARHSVFNVDGCMNGAMIGANVSVIRVDANTILADGATFELNVDGLWHSDDERFPTNYTYDAGELRAPWCDASNEWLTCYDGYSSGVSVMRRGYPTRVIGRDVTYHCVASRPTKRCAHGETLLCPNELDVGRFSVLTYTICATGYCVKTDDSNGVVSPLQVRTAEMLEVSSSATSVYVRQIKLRLAGFMSARSLLILCCTIIGCSSVCAGLIMLHVCLSDVMPPSNLRYSLALVFFVVGYPMLLVFAPIVAGFKTLRAARYGFTIDLTAKCTLIHYALLTFMFPLEWDYANELVTMTEFRDVESARRDSSSDIGSCDRREADAPYGDASEGATAWAAPLMTISDVIGCTKWQFFLMHLWAFLVACVIGPGAIKTFDAFRSGLICRRICALAFFIVIGSSTAATAMMVEGPGGTCHLNELPWNQVGLRTIDAVANSLIDFGAARSGCTFLGVDVEAVVGYNERFGLNSSFVQYYCVCDKVPMPCVLTSHYFDCSNITSVRVTPFADTIILEYAGAPGRCHGASPFMVAHVGWHTFLITDPEHELMYNYNNASFVAATRATGYAFVIPVARVSDIVCTGIDGSAPVTFDANVRVKRGYHNVPFVFGIMNAAALGLRLLMWGFERRTLVNRLSFQIVYGICSILVFVGTLPFVNLVLLILAYCHAVWPFLFDTLVLHDGVPLIQNSVLRAIMSRIYVRPALRAMDVRLLSSRRAAIRYSISYYLYLLFPILYVSKLFTIRTSVKLVVVFALCATQVTPAYAACTSIDDLALAVDHSDGNQLVAGLDLGHKGGCLTAAVKGDAGNVVGHLVVDFGPARATVLLRNSYFTPIVDDLQVFRTVACAIDVPAGLGCRQLMSGTRTRQHYSHCQYEHSLGTPVTAFSTFGDTHCTDGDRTYALWTYTRGSSCKSALKRDVTIRGAERKCIVRADAACDWITAPNMGGKCKNALNLGTFIAGSCDGTQKSGTSTCVASCNGQDRGHWAYVGFVDNVPVPVVRDINVTFVGSNSTLKLDYKLISPPIAWTAQPVAVVKTKADLRLVPATAVARYGVIAATGQLGTMQLRGLSAMAGILDHGFASFTDRRLLSANVWGDSLSNAFMEVNGGCACTTAVAYRNGFFTFADMHSDNPAYPLLSPSFSENVHEHSVGTTLTWSFNERFTGNFARAVHYMESCLNNPDEATAGTEHFYHKTVTELGAYDWRDGDDVKLVDDASYWQYGYQFYGVCGRGAGTNMQYYKLAKGDGLDPSDPYFNLFSGLNRGAISGLLSVRDTVVDHVNEDFDPGKPFEMYAHARVLGHAPHRCGAKAPAITIRDESSLSFTSVLMGSTLTVKIPGFLVRDNVECSWRNMSVRVIAAEVWTVYVTFSSDGGNLPLVFYHDGVEVGRARCGSAFFSTVVSPGSLNFSINGQVVSANIQSGGNFSIGYPTAKFPTVFDDGTNFRWANPGDVTSSNSVGDFFASLGSVFAGVVSALLSPLTALASVFGGGAPGSALSVIIIVVIVVVVLIVGLKLSQIVMKSCGRRKTA
uniref:Uncharacterized protein n=1 Tax=Leptomonas pyrrhocoris ostravirus TaxID=3070843 RepID=A0AA50KJ09_9VIRU|nr:hypothetical protein [Leptomonas pyrrhocoris ostravirus]